MAVLELQVIPPNYLKQYHPMELTMMMERFYICSIQNSNH